MSTPLGWLERVPTYKDQIEKLRERERAHPIEEVGKRLRDMMSWIRDAKKDSSDPNAR